MTCLKNNCRKIKMKSFFNCVRNFCSHQNVTPNICIVGAGPAGFYAAQQILKGCSNVKIDIVERLPVPFGLVRFGVAPDHPEVKNVIHTFQKIANDPRVDFFGNIDVGKDIRIKDLQNLYHATILSYGSEQDRLLNIPGEDLDNVLSARRFVGWYNGIPSDKDLQVNLNSEDVVILGQGNVAIDAARVLLSPIDKLKKTDITSHALEQLSESKVKRVWLVGRRGPLQAAFTIAELREMLKLENCKTVWRPEDFEGVKDIVQNLPRPRKRLTELMLKSLEETPLNNISNDIRNQKEFRPVFLRSPLEFLGNCSVEKIKFSKNYLDKSFEGDITKQQAKSTSNFEELDCGLAIRSIGYKSIQIDPDVPFDFERGRVLNVQGKIKQNLYAAGWVATGPVGVILTTMSNAFHVGKLLINELNTDIQKDGTLGLKEILSDKKIHIVTYQDWLKIDQEECSRGKSVDKPREKIVDISEMLEIASKPLNAHEEQSI